MPRALRPSRVAAQGFRGCAVLPPPDEPDEVEPVPDLVPELAPPEPPLDRVLVETDAPYLAPVPHRGRPNQPAWVADVGAALAAATGVPVDRISSATCENAQAVFGLRTSA